MTEAKAILLILAAAIMLETVMVLGLAVAGVRGPVLGLGAIVPLALASYASSSVVGRYSGRHRADR